MVILMMDLSALLLRCWCTICPFRAPLPFVFEVISIQMFRLAILDQRLRDRQVRLRRSLANTRSKMSDAAILDRSEPLAAIGLRFR